MAGNRRARGEKRPRRPDPEPLEVDAALVIAVGTVAWFIAWAVLLAFHRRLSDHGNEWWIWTAVAGLGLGVWGWLLVRRRAHSADRTDAEHTDAEHTDAEHTDAEHTDAEHTDALPAEAVPRGTGRRRKAPDDAG